MAPGFLSKSWRRALARLSTSQIFWVVFLLFLANLVIPDPLPVIDEVALGLLSVLVARWKMRGNDEEDEELEPKPAPKNVTPRKH